VTDQPESIVLVNLRRIDEKLDRVVEDLRDLKVRATAMVEGLAGVNRRLDRLETRVDRIERRLDLVGSEPA
jgi:archaellum component FlaC